MTDREEAHTYDLFISYAEADGAWVEGYLVNALLAQSYGLETTTPPSPNSKQFA